MQQAYHTLFAYIKIKLIYSPISMNNIVVDIYLCYRLMIEEMIYHEYESTWFEGNWTIDVRFEHDELFAALPMLSPTECVLVLMHAISEQPWFIFTIVDKEVREREVENSLHDNHDNRGEFKGDAGGSSLRDGRSSYLPTAKNSETIHAFILLLLLLCSVVTIILYIDVITPY